MAYSIFAEIVSRFSREREMVLSMSSPQPQTIMTEIRGGILLIANVNWIFANDKSLGCGVRTKLLSARPY